MTERILLGHGSGGRLMHELIEKHFSRLRSPGRQEAEAGTEDAALLDLSPQTSRLAFSTDSYVVSPLFFPGGNIGDLAVNGTVNDLAAAGSRPLWLSAGFIIEEGFSLDELGRIIETMARAAERAGVEIVAGDTKVVDRGKADRLFINTSGIGVLKPGIPPSAGRIRPGDSIILTGEIGRHGIAVMAERNGLSFSPEVTSDTAPLGSLVAHLLENLPEGAVRFMRDPTRGGLATTLKEAALASGLCMKIIEGTLPIPSGVKGACDLLGLDPLYVANEGLMLIVVEKESEEEALKLISAYDEFETRPVKIGSAVEEPASAVLLETSIGGSRVVDMLSGEQLPRIC